MICSVLEQGRPVVSFSQPEVGSKRNRNPSHTEGVTQLHPGSKDYSPGDQESQTQSDLGKRGRSMAAGGSVEVEGGGGGGGGGAATGACLEAFSA